MAQGRLIPSFFMHNNSIAIKEHMKRQFTKTQVLDQFKYNLKVDILAGRISKNDKPAIGMSWNVFTDMLHRDGYITDWQVNNWTNPFYG